MFTCADVARQALDLSKATFDNLYSTLATLQAMAEDSLTGAVAESSWIPGEVDGILEAWIGLLRRTRADVKDTVDRCHALLHALIARTSAAPGAGPADAPLPEPVTTVH